MCVREQLSNHFDAFRLPRTSTLWVFLEFVSPNAVQQRRKESKSKWKTDEKRANNNIESKEKAIAFDFELELIMKLYTFCRLNLPSQNLVLCYLSINLPDGARALIAPSILFFKQFGCAVVLRDRRRYEMRRKQIKSIQPARQIRATIDGSNDAGRSYTLLLLWIACSERCHELRPTVIRIKLFEANSRGENFLRSALFLCESLINRIEEAEEAIPATKERRWLPSQQKWFTVGITHAMPAENPLENEIK